jgi:RND family efflux transporter MFP subunit
MSGTNLRAPLLFSPSVVFRLLFLLPLGVAAGCSSSTAAPSKEKLPELKVGLPVEGLLTDSAYFTGRTQAIHSVELRARVTGYLDESIGPRDSSRSKAIGVEEGDYVPEGKVLFKVDPLPFQAAFNQARANLAQQQAQLKYAEGDYQRNTSIRTTGAVSVDDIAKALQGRDAAKAAVESAQAALETAKLNLAYTEIKAPFTGRVGRRQIDPGSLVQADNTILATLVQLDPLYAYFDIDERTLLQVCARLPDGRFTAETAAKLPVTLGLAHEGSESFSHPGQITITDNRVDASTGTLRVWGTFPNPKHDLYPNLFVRVRLGLSAPRKHWFVAEDALGSRQGNDFLSILVPAQDEKGEIKRNEDKVVWTVEEFGVKVGQRKDGMIAIEQGLEAADKILARLPDGEKKPLQIVVEGLQRIKLHTEVKEEQIKSVEMDPAKRKKR